MLHVDEAHDRAETILKEFLSDKPRPWRILLIKDLFARLRVVLWCPKSHWKLAYEEIDQGLQGEASAYWSRDVLRGCGKNEPPDGEWQDEAWQQGIPVADSDRLRVIERQRAKEGWFEAPAVPPWSAAKGSPTITSFYSFKGGVGRSTALAATALHLATAGERVVVLDVDLDAPGVGFLLSAHDGATAPWGVVDYLIEQPLLVGIDGLDLSDYFHRCPPSLFSGTGEIMVFPAGTTDNRYVGKLARLDYATSHRGRIHPFVLLLEQIRQELNPDWILIDSRGGPCECFGVRDGRSVPRARGGRNACRSELARAGNDTGATRSRPNTRTETAGRVCLGRSHGATFSGTPIPGVGDLVHRPGPGRVSVPAITPHRSRATDSGRWTTWRVATHRTFPSPCHTMSALCCFAIWARWRRMSC